MSTTDEDRASASGGDGSTTGRAELLVGALGGLLVLAALLFLGYQAVAVRDAGPELHAAVERVTTDRSGQHVVHFSVANDGGVTAEAVRVVGELRRDGELVEQVSNTLP